MSEPEAAPTDYAPSPHGPYLSVATFCESVLKEENGPHSIIRIVDTVTLTVRVPESVDPVRLAEALPELEAPVRLFIVAGGFPPGQPASLVLVLYEPDGERVAGTMDLPFMPGGRFASVNLDVGLTLVVKQPGVYWFDVTHENRVLGRTRVEIQIELVSFDSTQPGKRRSTILLPPSSEPRE